MEFITLVLNIVFGCRHPENWMTRPFTNTKGVTYANCLRCGTERLYDMDAGCYYTERSGKPKLKLVPNTRIAA